jgi:acyl carrier protein phosphodiesterase
MAGQKAQSRVVKTPSIDEQTRLGLAARAYYTAYLARNKSRANAFDTQMLGLFGAIAAHQPDIDARIEQVHQVWRSESFFQRFVDRAKLDLVYSAMSRRLARHQRTAPTLTPLISNWTRLLRIGNKHWGNKETMAPRWVNQASSLNLSEL